MIVEINGANITAQISSVIKNWQDYNSDIEVSGPEEHINNLNSIQNYFCTKLLDKLSVEDKEVIISFLANMSSLKDELKLFIPEKRKSNQKEY